MTKTTDKIKKDQENGARLHLLEDLFYDFNRSRGRVYWMNFVRGIYFGLGSVIGGTIIIAIIIWCMSLLVDIPGGVGDFIQQVLDILQQSDNKA